MAASLLLLTLVGLVASQSAVPLYLPGADPQALSASAIGTGTDNFGQPLTTYAVVPLSVGDGSGFLGGTVTLVENTATAAAMYAASTEGVQIAISVGCSLGASVAECNAVLVENGQTTAVTQTETIQYAATANAGGATVTPVPSSPSLLGPSGASPVSATSVAGAGGSSKPDASSRPTAAATAKSSGSADAEPTSGKGSGADAISAGFGALAGLAGFWGVYLVVG